MSKTIRRGTPPRKVVANGNRKLPVVRKQSVIDRALLMLPVSEATLKRGVTLMFTGAVLAGLFALSTLFGVPQAAGFAVAEALGDAGFRVRSIEVKGAARMNAMTVYAAVLDQKSRAMPLVDLGAVRAKLLRYGWIADAQVSRRLPDRLVINLVERREAALWQYQGRVMLIDADGVPLEAVAPEKAPALPLLIGPGANEQIALYRRLLDSAPAMKPVVKAATWVGNRRWDLLFDTGETLQLPEEGAAQALVKFAEIEGKDRLLGRGWARFDLRDPNKFVARKSSEAAPRAMTDTSAIETASWSGETG